MSTEPPGFFDDGVDGAPADVPESVPRPRSPYRIALVVAIVAAGVAGGVVDAVVSRPAPIQPPGVPANEIAPAAVESSAWYCAGGTPANGSTAAETLHLLNTTGHQATATLSAVSDTGAHKSERVVIPSFTQIEEVPGALAGGGFVAATVTVAGGGVLVTESVAGPLGWSVTPCSRSTATDWYFASGSTVNGGTLAISLYNPTSTVAVVDMTFATPSGISQPQPFEGIVVAPGSLAVEQIDHYVQDARSVSTVVSVRTGSVVAAALQTVSSNGSHGLSVRLGSPQPERAWALPRSIDLTGGLSVVTVFNPTSRSERVRIDVRPFRSPPASFTQFVAPTSAWVLETSGQNRIPDAIPFLATVRVVGRGAGVVVDRSVDAPSSFGGPQFGAMSALGLTSGTPGATSAVLPGPGTDAHPAVNGAAVATLDLYNPGSRGSSATVWAIRGSHLVRVARAEVAAGRAVSLASTASTGVQRAAGMGRVGFAPLVVTASEPLLVLEDLVPAATAGVVSLPAVGRASG